MASVNINSNMSDHSHHSKMPNLVRKSKNEENGIKNVIVNSRRIGTKYRIRLTKSENGGFGFKIAERDNMFGKNRPIYITAITTTGSAYRDGRLKEGDMLLEVNDIDLSGKSQPEVTRMLKSVGVNESVEFVVSRQEDHHQINNDYVNLEQDHDQIEKRIDSIFNEPCKDGPGTYIYDIPLNQTKSAGLGLYLKYPTQDGKDLGIWIEKVITGGAAWKDGRLQPDDQILAVNGINLMKMSNTEATDTLMAAVSRGLGPEATSDTIRLHINRRDPLVVSRILHGINNNKTRYSDNQSSKQDKSLCSSNDNSSSNKSSNQNSQEDSALSPQTQASNSLKLSSSGSDKYDQNSSDKTNDTSSAISQITDFTTMDLSNVENQNAFTLPKTLDLVEGTQSVDPSSIQSWDDESIDNVAGEERFQRDGFGRQSISEKRHAQLCAKNTDTYKRNQELKEERERQRQLEEQMARHCLDDGLIRDSANHSPHREVPVDVQIPLKSEQSHRYFFENNQNPIRDYHQGHLGHLDQFVKTPFNQNERIFKQYLGNDQLNRCIKCGSDRSCICRATSLVRPQIHQGYDNPALKRSNSMESIQHQAPMHEGLIIPRAGTVRVARNRKINESFRAAVDRSYEGSMNESSYVGNDQRSNTSAKITSSIANSTISTTNDERFLIGEANGKNNTTHKKSSSLLTRFLKFGSMKKDKKNKSKDSQKQLADSAKVPKDTQSRNSVRSSYSQGCRLHQSSQGKVEADMDRQLQQQSQTIKQQTLQRSRQAQVSTPSSHRASMHMYQYQPMTNSHQNHNQFSPIRVQQQQIPPSLPLERLQQQQQQQAHHQLPVDHILNHPMQYQPVVSRNNMIQNPSVGLPNNGYNNPPQLFGPPIHTPNGLWVANSPVAENQFHPSHNIYGSHTQHAGQFHNQQPSVNIHHPAPFVPILNGHSNSNGMFHQSPVLPGHISTMTQQHLHNQQPRHIYYYDF